MQKLQIVIAVISTVVFCIIGYVDFFFIINYYKNLTPWILTQNLFVLLCAMGVNAVLVNSDEDLFTWTWTKYFKERAKGLSNVCLRPILIPRFGVLYYGLLLLCLPTLAYSEEAMFRLGTTNLLEGVGRSFLFGLSHLVVGVPLGYSLAIFVPGMWLTTRYLQGGIEAAAMHHFAYNLLVIGLLTIMVIHDHIWPSDDNTPEPSGG